MLVVLVLTLIMYSENEHFAAIEDKVFLGSPFVGKAEQCLAEEQSLHVHLYTAVLTSERYLTSPLRALLCFLQRTRIHTGSARDCLSSC